MEKVSITSFTEKIIEQHGSDEAEAIMIIALDGQKITMSSIGTDPLFINDKSVALAGAMQTILDDRFKAARTMYEYLKRNGRFVTEVREQICDTPAEAFAAAKPKQAAEAKTESDPERAFIHELFELIERNFGGGKDANDD